MEFNLKKITATLWRVFLFTFPFSLHWVLYDKFSYRFGNFNPWVTGFLFLPELLLILTFVLWAIEKHRSHTLKWTTPGWGALLIFLFLINVGFVTFLKGDPVLYLFFIVRVGEAVVVYHLSKARIIPGAEQIKWLLYSAVFQIFLGYLQTRFNHSLGLPFLGEPVLGPEILNVAKTDLAEGVKAIRPYGTFLHPNILGAYLVTVLLLSLSYLKKAALPFWVILLSVGVYLTGSQAAEITLLLSAGYLLVLNWLKSIRHQKRLVVFTVTGYLLLNAFLFFFSPMLSSGWSSIQERLLQNAISLKMFLNQLWGVGVGNFTLMMEQFADQKLLPWEFQPVHNVYFLALNETGLQGLLLLIAVLFYLLRHFWKNTLTDLFTEKVKLLPLFGLIFMASFDHLLWTSSIGFLLAGLVVAEIST